MLVNLTARLQKLEETESQRVQLGALGHLCTPFKVTAGDTAARQSLVIGGTVLDRLKDKMPVIFVGGLVGRLDPPGVVVKEQGLIKGAGKNTVIIEAMKQPLADHVELNDWVVLEDGEWPAAVQGEQIGRVINKGASGAFPGYTQITLQPATDLMQLNEVMVLTKQ